MALDFMAGCLGGCAGVMVGHPFDTVKVCLQTQDFRNPQYKGTFHCLTQIVRKESIFGLYKGMSSPMTGVAVVNAIVFGVYGNIQRRLPNPDSYWSHALAGSAAGFFQAFICSPMELVKTRIQLQDNTHKLYKSPLDCIVQIGKSEGLRGLFRGLGITITREVPGFGTYFLSYELMTKSSDKSAPPLSTWHMLLAGGLAGTISWIITYPVDVLKSRVQVDGMVGPRKYTGVVDCYRKSVALEGYSFLTRGLSSTIMRAFPTNAACFTVVTWVFRLVGEDDNSTHQLISDYDKVASRYALSDEIFSFNARSVLQGFDMHKGYFSNLFHWKKFGPQDSTNASLLTNLDIAHPNFNKYILTNESTILSNINHILGKDVRTNYIMHVAHEIDEENHETKSSSEDNKTETCKNKTCLQQCDMNEHVSLKTTKRLPTDDLHSQCCCHLVQQ